MHRLSSTLLLLLVLSGCGQPAPTADKPKTDGEKSDMIKVRLVSPKAREVEYPGRVKPFMEAPIHVRVPGYIRSIDVDIDDVVTGPKEGAKVPGPDEPETAENSGQVLARLA